MTLYDQLQRQVVVMEGNLPHLIEIFLISGVQIKGGRTLGAVDDQGIALRKGKGEASTEEGAQAESKQERKCNQIANVKRLMGTMSTYWKTEVGPRATGVSAHR